MTTIKAKKVDTALKAASLPGLINPKGVQEGLRDNADTNRKEPPQLEHAAENVSRHVDPQPAETQEDGMTTKRGIVAQGGTEG